MGEASDDDSSGSGPKHSVTEVAGESFVRERPPDIERGTVLANRYQIEEIIGKGGSGIVLRVFDRTAQIVVALKVLKSELARDAKWDKRFSRELRLARPIQHRNVCRVFDIGEADGHKFLTMELAKGGSLREELKRGLASPRPFADRLADGEAVIAGLAALHKAGIVHRDFKPDNLLRMEDGRLVLSDFGLATDSANAPGVTVLIGTPHYMAPEVLAGEPATVRSDVWALGVVLHEIFFGRRPERRAVSFDGSNKVPMRPSSSIERAMLALCERCLAESPLDRPSDAGEVAEIFKAERLRPGRRERARHRRYFLTTTLGLLMGMVVVAGITRKIRRRRASANGTENSAVVSLSPSGEAADWRKLARVIAELSGHVDCFSMLGPNTAQLIWGSPRRVEEIEIANGRRRPGHLRPETYAGGCPQYSPDGQHLLFTALNDGGTTEIRLSDQRDGAHSVTVVSGSGPLWLPHGEEFAYDVDAYHAAVFALPTSSSTLLADGDPHERRWITEKAINSTTGEVALLLGSTEAKPLIAIYSAGEFGLQKAFSVPGAVHLYFEDSADRLLVSYQVSASRSSLTQLDWKNGLLRELGSYAGLDLLTARPSDGGLIVLGRHRSNDVWLYGEGPPRRLTYDGQNFSAALSPSGDLLLSKRGAGGQFTIWWQGRDGTTQEVSAGPADVGPQYSPDGQSWVYTDYARKSIFLCSVGSGACHVVVHDELLPGWARFSPDGKRLAYITQINVPKLRIVTLDGGDVRRLGDAYIQCLPIWTTPESVWTFEGTPGHYFWSEWSIRTDAKTGGRVDVTAPENQSTFAGSDQIRCWPSDVGPDSPFFPRLRVEAAESSTLLRLPQAPAK
ncbi:MAG TPA: protein kinase [Polyangia bacterium]|nr:protein kinase [Polyangia bacterium]